MSDYRSRLFDEHRDLRVKVEKLREFILSDKYDVLPDIDKTDLKIQLKHMTRYLDVLLCRVSRQCGNA